jgi:hypothetical protein
MRVLAAVVLALAVVAARAEEDFLVEESFSEEIANGAADAGAFEAAQESAGDDAGDDATAGGRKLLYTAPQVVTTVAPAGVNCAWGAWSAWSTCYQNAYSKDEPLRCNLVGLAYRVEAFLGEARYTGGVMMTHRGLLKGAWLQPLNLK